jgi:hypothetical protein
LKKDEQMNCKIFKTQRFLTILLKASLWIERHEGGSGRSSGAISFLGVEKSQVMSLVNQSTLIKKKVSANLCKKQFSTKSHRSFSAQLLIERRKGLAAVAG